MGIIIVGTISEAMVMVIMHHADADAAGAGCSCERYGGNIFTKFKLGERYGGKLDIWQELQELRHVW